MKKYPLIVVFNVALFGALPMVMSAAADTIFLKDGTREESDRVWESEGYVHFILKGTRTVEIRYAKEIVDRVERTPNRGAPAADRPSDTRTSAPRPGKMNSKKKGQAPTHRKPPERQVSGHVDLKMVQVNKGISFYDPHRPFRYWASRHSKHKTLEEAVSVLARTYGRSARWVQENMGEENDLGSIHHHLMRQLSLESGSETGAEAPQTATAKPLPNITDRPATLSKSGGHDAGRRSLAEDITASSSDRPQFYNPRRTKKYWTSPSTGFDTLAEAIAALAKQYQVPKAWIEEHLGPSNRLEDIHRSIRQSLAAD